MRQLITTIVLGLFVWVMVPVASVAGDAGHATVMADMGDIVEMPRMSPRCQTCLDPASAPAGSHMATDCALMMICLSATVPATEPLDGINVAGGAGFSPLTGTAEDLSALSLDLPPPRA